MIRETYAESDAGPAEYAYSDPVECAVCRFEYDLEGHRNQLFDLYGTPDPDAVICEDCDLLCAWCENSVLESLPMRIKQVQDGVVWIDGKPYHGDCVPVAVCQEAA